MDYKEIKKDIRFKTIWYKTKFGTINRIMLCFLLDINEGYYGKI